MAESGGDGRPLTSFQPYRITTGGALRSVFFPIILTADVIPEHANVANLRLSELIDVLERVDVRQKIVIIVFRNLSQFYSIL